MKRPAVMVWVVALLLWAGQAQGQIIGFVTVVGADRARYMAPVAPTEQALFTRLHVEVEYAGIGRSLDMRYPLEMLGTPVPTNTPTPTITPTPTRTPTRTATPRPTSTITPTPLTMFMPLVSR